ncbi:hypothetical protein T492DRAFT_906046 [Pavlovales sp. CCMP2436]|nr:hypothetical protein T492DRAFT_906046 [Pavlovales sp. CCMP2436]
MTEAMQDLSPPEDQTPLVKAGIQDLVVARGFGPQGLRSRPVGAAARRIPTAGCMLLALGCALAVALRLRPPSLGGGDGGGWTASGERACPVPRMLVPDAICASVFERGERRPCTLGNHTAMCTDFPTRPLTLGELEHAWRHSPAHTVRVQIIGGVLFIVPRAENLVCRKAPWVMISQLLRMLETARKSFGLETLPDVDVLISPGDGSPLWPIIGLNNPVNRPRFERTYMVPTHLGLDGLKPPKPRPPGCSKPTKGDALKWASKLDAVVFRGSSSGPHLDTKTWRGNTRARLAVLSHLFPEWADASLTKYGANASETEMLARFLGPKRYLPARDYSKYKFIMDIDGNVQANRFPGLLLRGSVVLQSTQFVSVRPDLSDLLNTLGCLRHHTDLTLARLKHGKVILLFLFM